MTFDREIILRMLKLYKEMPFLWDKHHKNYKNQSIRNEGLKTLLQVYKEFERNATVKTMNKKIGNLRTSYVKEYRKVIESKRPGAKVYVPTLYYYNALSFLAPHMDPSRPKMDPLEIEFQDDSSDEETHREPQCLYINTTDFSEPEKKRLKEESSLVQEETFMPTAGAVLNIKEKEEDWEIHGKAIGLQLRDLDKTSLRIAQKLISDAIYYASIGALNHNSSIALEPPTHDIHNAAPAPSTSPYRCQEPHPYHRSFHNKCCASPDSQARPLPSPQCSIHSSHSSTSPQQNTSQPPSSSHQVQKPLPPPSPHHEEQSLQPAHHHTTECCNLKQTFCKTTDCNLLSSHHAHMTKYSQLKHLPCTTKCRHLKHPPHHHITKSPIQTHKPIIPEHNSNQNQVPTIDCNLKAAIQEVLTYKL